MDHWLLQTKLSTPALRSKRVIRQRLIDILNDGLWQGEFFGRKLTLISAPAGFGKTTLAVEWLNGVEKQIAWLSLDEGDNDPARFIIATLVCLQQLDPNCGMQTKAMLQAQQTLPPETLLTPLINDLTNLPGNLILVLEDFHEVPNPLIQRMASFLLEHQPRRMHLVVITREDPLMPIGRLRAQGQVREVRQDDLRFSEEETADFFDHYYHFNLSRQDVQALQRRTEGWAAGLQLAALSMQKQANLHKFIRTFTGSNRFILDYLFEEVYSQQGPEIQDFMVKTSILERLNPELCDAVLERNDSQTFLHNLEHANLFIIPLGSGKRYKGPGEWYRYHQLFRDLLRHQLQIQPGSDETTLHQRAAEWYERQRLLPEALQHALAARDWVRSAELIHRQVAEMLKAGEIVTLLDWFRKFPDDFIRSQIQLCIDFSWPLILGGEYEAAESYLTQAEAYAPPDSPILGEIYSVQAFLARSRGDMRRTIELSEKALALSPKSDLNARAVLSVNLGLAYWHAGLMSQAELNLRQAAQDAEVSENMYALLTAKIFLGRVSAVRGQLHQAANIYRELVQQGKQTPILALALLDLGTLEYEWNELEICREHLTQGTAMCEAIGNMDFQSAGCLMLARLEIAEGNLKASQEWLEKLWKLAHSKDTAPTLIARAAAAQTLAAVMRRDLESAKAWEQQIDPDLDAHPFYRFLGLTKEYLLIAEGRNEEAARRLAPKYETAEQAGWNYGAITARVYQALATQNPPEAVALICQALELSYPGGFVRTYTDVGTALVPLLREAAGQGVHPEYVGRILRAIEGAERQAQAAADLVEPLSERELEVLRLAAAGLSNQEIAEQLTISLGTVKTHLHNIYGKLEVGSRSKAIARAKELNVLI